MAILEDIIALNTRFFSQWNTTAVPVVSDGQAPSPEPTATWARWSIQPDTSASWAGSGSQKIYKQNGVAYVQIFAPIAADPTKSAQRVALELADTAATIFRNWSSGTLATGFMKAGRIVTKTVGESDGWYQINVTIYWTSDRLL